MAKSKFQIGEKVVVSGMPGVGTYCGQDMVAGYWHCRVMFPHGDVLVKAKDVRRV